MEDPQVSNLSEEEQGTAQQEKGQSRNWQWPMYSMTQSKLLSLLVSAGFCLTASSFAQNLINVKIAGGAPGAPSGAAVIGAAGDVWNYFPNLNTRANNGGVVTNATTNTAGRLKNPPTSPPWRKPHWICGPTFKAWGK